MAVLIEQDRFDVWAEVMRHKDFVSASGVTKADLRAAADAIDNYLNTNASAINTAIPQPARANLSTPVKALLLMFVIQKRYQQGA